MVPCALTFLSPPRSVRNHADPGPGSNPKLESRSYHGLIPCAHLAQAGLIRRHVRGA